MKSIALIGLGRMGSAIAERLLQGAVSLTVFNRTFEKAKPFEAKGATVAATLDAAVSTQSLVITSLFDDASVLDISQTLAQHLPKGACHINMATVLPDTAEALTHLHHQHHQRYVSAPILGAAEVVRSGSARIFYAGDVDDAVEQALALIAPQPQCMGDKASHANAMKVSMNYLMLTLFEAMAELMPFMAHHGIDRDDLSHGMKAWYAHPIAHHYIDKITQGGFDHVNFDVHGGLKDAALFAQALKDAGARPIIAEQAQAWMRQAIEQGKGGLDWSIMADMWRDDQV